ncbi:MULTISPECIES: diguanylate cyclase [Acinetobacter]|uniref:Diguanylate cyclase DosC n=1 Tax=Acinetobacter indicus TaxID=756892 RepID=A0A7S7ADI3_9GAMM|nr:MULTISPECIES: diguanylate cyclase [Acinetobacter]MCP0916922.1 diguanylate cyclase [Acinetobacter indicus]MCP0920035.1 diguanylate cyclase [Acinetobacter indicus]MCP0922702.1 diguanylate cyclase [Acinetobacter indicus]QIC75627.1 diguanylate cyclase [Acinetobacter indicus]QOW41947.1 diguanylate cyclase [Acinetobacter indicus]
MNQERIEELAAQWQAICGQFSETDLSYSFEFIQQHVTVLVAEFYRQMMQEQEASYFLSDELVRSRLKNALQQWLLDSFAVPFKQDFKAIVAKQLKVGEVHARIGVPSWLIIRGIREIQRKSFAFFLQTPQADVLAAADYMTQVLSLAAEIMCRTYEAKVEIHNDMKHTYRLFSAMQDVAVQKDRQRGCLLDWENELMFKAFSDQSQLFHPPLSKSEFGLWFIHKAAYAFASAEQVEFIIQRIYQVDQLNQQLLDTSNQQQKLLLIQQIRCKNREIQHLVDQLFQVAEYIGTGNDSLTQLLNRRYLNTILIREIQFSRKNRSPLSLLAIDADFFKEINDRYGHAAGDLALQFMAEVLLESSKGSDYAFRVGGEEFLLLLVDSDWNRAQMIAETIRRRVEDTPIRSAEGESFKFTVSIGAVQYDGHPDYQRFLDAADAALYSAKNAGRNQVYLAK